MKTVLQELTILPGVIGSCIVVNNADVLTSSLPDFFDENMAKEASNNISRMMQMAAVKGLAPKNMSIRYDRFIILTIPINEKSVLLVLCETGSNTALVATTAGMLSPELSRKLTSDTPTEQSTPATATATAKVSPAQQKETTKATNDALAQIKEALFSTVGPVADMVYEDCRQRWSEKGDEDIARIFELLACISQEIDNSDLFAEFKGKISSLL
jgi:predicted regulator of Ras-like GTPase activity (Roadblock/LC7/MglB family)